MSLKKKKGSSLIAVLLIFAILSISGASILSLTVSDYNAKITASKKIQSLYESDSGVNVVYGIMKKVTSQGIQKGNKSAEDYMNKFTGDSVAKDDPLKGIYKDLYSADGSLNTNKLKLKLNNIFQDSYKSYILSYITKYITSSDKYLENGKYADLNENIVSLYDTSTIANLPTIIVSVKAAKPNQWKVLTISSQFFTTPISGQTSNKKTVQADIVIGIPDYQNSYYVETKKQEVTINPVWKNAISIDGDMHINSDIRVDGDIFVMGKPPVVGSEKVYTKYNGGISIGSDDANPIKAIFNKNVVTSNSFNISGQNKEVIVEGNIYAGNVYIGKSSSTEAPCSDSSLTVKDPSGPSTENGMVYTSNDLSLYATKSDIDIDKYYGINDIGGIRTVDKVYNSSSSLIVNTDDLGIADGSSINIGDAIINGTAYINTNEPYQTGESVAVKGNYRAYTIPIPKSAEPLYDESKAKYDEDKVNFVYNSPLQLVDSFKEFTTKLTGADKSEYFRKINDLKLTALNKSGITIKNLIFSAGVALSGGFVSDKSIDISKIPDIEAKQNEFAKVVYEMGDITNVGVPKLADEAKMLNDDYLTGKVNKGVFAGKWVADRDKNDYLIDKVAQVSLSKVDNSNSIDVLKSEVECRTSKNVVILGTGSTYTAKPTDEIIDLSTMSDPHGIIITSGNVTLSGKVDFTGTIIAGGNLTTTNDGLKTLTYDDNYVLKTIARDYTNTYSKVFNIIEGMNTQIVEVAATVGGDANAASNGIDGGVVKLSNWRVNN